MYHRTTARIVAIAMGLAPALWAPTATAQKGETPGPIRIPVPDLVVIKTTVNCNSVAVTVRNDGDTMRRNTSPIVVRMSALMSIEGPYPSIDNALALTNLEGGQVATLNFPLEYVGSAISVESAVDFTTVINESNETNNKRTAIDERTCPVLRVSNASVGAGGDLVFTASLDRRPLNDASFSWSTSPQTATGGAACGGLVDFETASGTARFSSSGAVPPPITVIVKTCGHIRSSNTSETMRLAFGSFRNLQHQQPIVFPLGTIEVRTVPGK